MDRFGLYPERLIADSAYPVFDKSKRTDGTLSRALRGGGKPTVDAEGSVEGILGRTRLDRLGRDAAWRRSLCAAPRGNFFCAGASHVRFVTSVACGAQHGRPTFTLPQGKLS